MFLAQAHGPPVGETNPGLHEGGVWHSFHAVLTAPTQTAGPDVTAFAPDHFVLDAAVDDKWQLPSAKREKYAHPGVEAHRAWQSATVALVRPGAGERTTTEKADQGSVCARARARVCECVCTRGGNCASSQSLQKDRDGWSWVYHRPKATVYTALAVMQLLFPWPPQSSPWAPQTASSAFPSMPKPFPQMHLSGGWMPMYL